MVKRAVIVAGIVDPITMISADAAYRVAEIYRKHGFEVDVISGVMATRLPLFIALLKPASIICYFGHAWDDMWMGDEVLWGLVERDNVDWLSDTVSVAVPACRSLRKLGLWAVQHGAVSYIGFDEDAYGGFPETDHNYAEDFIDCWVQLYRSLAIGETVSDAVNDFKDRCEYYAERYKELRLPNSDFYSMAMMWNARHIDVRGDPSARIRDVPSAFKFRFSGLPKTFCPVLMVAGVAAPIVYDYAKRRGWI